jgi:(2Fe-2S) ferredoxin
MANEPDLDLLRETARGLGIGRATHHVLLCAEQTKPVCSTWDEGHEAWLHLKKRVAELGLDGKVVVASGDPDARCVHRSKVNCLRVCKGGPIAVVYPDGVWYHGVTKDVVERILVEHVLGGRVVEEHVLTRDALEGR